MTGIELPHWMQPLDELLNRYQRQGAFMVAMPEYREDLMRSLSESLDLVFFDFRTEVMANYGWQTGQFNLPMLEDALCQQARDHSILAHNTEALLATHDSAVRRDWLNHLFAKPWPHAVVFPLSLYDDQIPVGEERRCRLDMAQAPQTPMLGRRLNR